MGESQLYEIRTSNYARLDDWFGREGLGIKTSLPKELWRWESLAKQIEKMIRENVSEYILPINSLEVRVVGWSAARKFINVKITKVYDGVETMNAANLRGVQLGLKAMLMRRAAEKVESVGGNIMVFFTPTDSPFGEAGCVICPTNEMIYRANITLGAL